MSLPRAPIPIHRKQTRLLASLADVRLILGCGRADPPWQHALRIHDIAERRVDRLRRLLQEVRTWPERSHAGYDADADEEATVKSMLERALVAAGKARVRLIELATEHPTNGSGEEE